MTIEVETDEINIQEKVLKRLASIFAGKISEFKVTPEYKGENVEEEFVEWQKRMRAEREEHKKQIESLKKHL